MQVLLFFSIFEENTIFMTDGIRKIIHVDMDAFYASIEQRDNPFYRGKPIAVGYSGPRGVVAAASYEARKYGVRSAMASSTAKTLCPHLIFVQGRMNQYKAVSQEIMEIFYEYTDLVEQLSIDEAYLDITENKKNNRSGTLIAREIKKKIRDKTGLTASAGVSVNKFLAKIASDMDKPDGLYVITDKEAVQFVESLNIEKFWGVGKVTAQKMHSLGIFTGSDLKRFSESELIRHFGKAGITYYENARAIDKREVVPFRIRKSIGAENTFSIDIDDKEELLSRITDIAVEVWRRLSKKEFYGRTVTLKVKYFDFESITRSITLPDFIYDFDTLLKSSQNLFEEICPVWKKIRLMGISVSNPGQIEGPEEYIQLKIDFGEGFY